MKKFLLLMAGFMFALATNLSAQDAAAEKPQQKLTGSADFCIWSNAGDPNEGYGFETGMNFNYLVNNWFNLGFGGSYEIGDYEYSDMKDENGDWQNFASDYLHFYVSGKFALYSGEKGKLTIGQLIGTQVNMAGESDDEGKNPYAEFASSWNYSFSSSDVDSFSFGQKFSYNITDRGNIAIDSSDGFHWAEFGYSRKLSDAHSIGFGVNVLSCNVDDYNNGNGNKIDFGKIDISPSISYTYVDAAKDMSVTTGFFTDLYIDNSKGKDNEFSYDVGGWVSLGF